MPREASRNPAANLNARGVQAGSAHCGAAAAERMQRAKFLPGSYAWVLACTLERGISERELCGVQLLAERRTGYK